MDATEPLATAGTNIPQEIEKCLGYCFQFGYAFPLRSSGGGGTEKRIDLDAGYVYLDNSDLLSYENITDRHVLPVRGAFALELAPNVSLTGGVGLAFCLGTRSGGRSQLMW